MVKARHADLSDSLQIKNLIDLTSKSEFQYHKDTLGLLHYYIAIRQSRKKEIENVIDNTSKAIRYFEEIGFDDYQLARCYLIRANSKQSLGLSDDAEKDYKVIISQLNIYGRGFSSLSKAYKNIAAQYRLKGEFESSIRYLKRFIESEQFNSIDSTGKATSYRELSIAYAMYTNQEKLQLASNAIQNAIRICDSFDRNDVKLLEHIILNNMHEAYINWQKGNYKLAINQYQDALQQMESEVDKRVFRNLSLVSCINLSQLYLEIENCEEVIHYVNKSEELFVHYGNPAFIEIETELLLSKAGYFRCIEDLNSAAKEVEKAKNLLLFNTDTTSIKFLRNYPFKEYLIDNLYTELQVIYENTNRDPLLRLTQLKTKTLQLDSLINYYLEDLYFNSSMWALKDNLDDFYKLAIDLSFESADLNNFWYYSEQRSNILILKNQQYESQGKEAKQTQMDEDLLILKRNAATLDNTIYFLEDSLDNNKKDSLSILLNRNRAEQLSLLEKRTATSEYEMVNTIISLDDFDKRIDDNTTVLHFQFGTDSLYVLKIEKGEAKVYNIGESDDIKSLITNWFSFTSQSGEQSSELNSEDEVSTQLFDNLIKPIGPLKKNVLILPDEELSFLSFDALTNSTGEYLIQDHCIRYDLSGTLAVKHLANHKIKINDISAFLPNYSHSDLAQLSNTAEDIKSLEGHPHLNLFSEKDIDQDQFIASLQESDLVHFGGHAIHVDENNQYSHLAFVSEKEDEVNMISLGDLYSLKSISPLIALPACNTGTGAVMQGEGISSLSRGFFHAGAQSVISSLWNVNDKSTSFIMNAFYENLKAGESTADALRLAKLNYLETTPDFLRQPYLWSGLILTGSDSMVELSKPIHFLIKLGLALLFLLGVGYFIISRSNSNKIKAVSN